MPVSPDDPAMAPWLRRQPLDADRLDYWQSRTITDLRAGPGLLSARKGNSVTISLATQPRPRNLGFFPVKVEKTGGTDGNLTTVADWRFTVRRQQWTGSGTSADFELGTNMAQVKPLPKGKMLFQASSTGYGVGFYDEGGNFQLWDAGLVPDVGTC